MTTTILLDADIPIFKFASVSQEVNPSWDEGGEDEVVAKELEEVTPEIDAYVEMLLNKLNADEIVVCLSEPSREKNWRRTVLPTYKDKRSKTASPILRQALTDYMEGAYRSFLKPTLEGDDVLGILATNPKVIKGTKIIVSADKDLRTIPSLERKDSINLMYNPDKDNRPYFNHPHEADWFWMFQTLIGDTTDGYTGLPKCGPTRALEVLDYPKEINMVKRLWKKVVAEYEKKRFTETDALVQAQVARICRTEDFNYKTKRAIPWTPS